MSKTKFFDQCQKAIENFENGNGKLARAQMKVLETTLSKRFSYSTECIEAVERVWDAEQEYIRKNKKEI